MTPKKIFADFDKITTTQWEEAILKDLKGADYKTRLITPTIDGINIKPYYRKEQTSNLKTFDVFPDNFPFVRGNNSYPKAHKIRQDFIVNDYAKANLNIINIIEKGITSIGIIFEDTKITSEDISILLKDINLDKIQIVFVLPFIAENFVDVFIKFLTKSDYHNFDFVIDFDPIGNKTINGTFSDENYIKLTSNIFNKSIRLQGIKILNIKGNYFKDAGSSSVQELAFALSIASEYLLIAKDNGFDIDKFASKIAFTFGVGSNYFMEIAKLRAARLLWSKILQAYGLKDLQNAKMTIHTVTSNWNKTAYDPYVNVLRTTTEAMSAIIGGTETLLVKPFNSSYEKANDFSERIARNIQIILNEEAYFDKFIDPAGGSYYIENLTNSIAENTWDLFLKIEDYGGYNKAFDNGFIKNEVEQLANKRDMAIAMKKEVILGTNQYAARDEHLDFQTPKSSKAKGYAIKIYRGAEAFEELRQRTEQSTKKPKVLLLTFGNLTMRKARASFATNFFACAGFEIVENDVITTPFEGVKQIEESNCDIAVLCSSDDEYLDFAKEIFNRVGDNSIVTIAGYPKKYIDELKNIGIHNFIHVKSNILETLKSFQDNILK